MRVFVSDLEGYVGRALRKRLAQEEDVTIVGTVASGEAAPAKVAAVVQVGWSRPLPRARVATLVCPTARCRTSWSAVGKCWRGRARQIC